MKLTPRTRGRGLLAAAVVQMALVDPVAAQLQSGISQAGTEDHGARPAVRVRRTTSDVRIDGRLDEAAWENAEVITDFLQVEPDAGRPVSQRTEVRILLGTDAIYVGASLHDDQAHALVKRLTRRDDPPASDYFAISFDPYHDHQSGVRFVVTPAGSVQDATLAGGPQPDYSWDPVWEASASITADGWFAELRIPLSQLRFQAAAEATWGIQIERFIHRRQEIALLAWVARGDRSGVERYGHLHGLTDLPDVRHLEVLPYVALSRQSTPVAGAAADASSGHVRAGGDVRAGITRTLRLTGTINPDFGQVEVDPAVVNLTAFETIFPERRPFFVEGAGFFGFGRIRAFNFGPHPNAFFSRRVGRAPQLAQLHGVVENADRSRIAEALKLTGRTDDGWTLGLLQAHTLREEAHLTFGDTMRTVMLEPATEVGVARIARSLRGGATSVGAIATHTRRHLSDSIAARFLRSTATVGGLDVNHAWNSHRWALDANMLVSRVQGSAPAIDRTQRSSARYFQRPDQRHSRYDPTRTSLSGHAAEIALTKLRGAWVGNLTYQETSPGFEANDLGFHASAGRRQLATDWHYQRNSPGRIFRNYIIWPFTNHAWNWDGQRLQNNNFSTFNFWVEGQLLNYFGLTGWIGYDPRAWNDELTRGGPLTLAPARLRLHGKFSSDPRRTWAGGITAEQLRDDGGGRTALLALNTTLRARSNLNIRFDPSYSRRVVPAQYVRAVPDPLFEATGGSRYVFAELKDRILSLDTRIDWVLSPTLSLQAYVQLLSASGRFSDLKQLGRPRSFAFDVFGRDTGTIVRNNDGSATIDADGTGAAQPFTVPPLDFKLLSTRANAVFRWEYRPGATLFVAWQQIGMEQLPRGDLRPVRDLESLLRVYGDHVLVIKATYWLGL